MRPLRRASVPFPPPVLFGYGWLQLSGCPSSATGFFPVNVQGNVRINVPMKVFVHEAAPRQFASLPATGFRFDIDDNMPLTQVCESQVSSIAVNEPPTQTNTQTVDSCPPDENSGPTELPDESSASVTQEDHHSPVCFNYSFAYEGPKHEPEHEPEPEPKRRKAPVARAPFDGPAPRNRNTVARAPFEGPALRIRNKGKNPFSFFCDLKLVFITERYVGLHADTVCVRVFYLLFWVTEVAVFITVS